MRHRRMGLVAAVLLLGAVPAFPARRACADGLTNADGHGYGYGSVGTRDFIQYWSAYRAFLDGQNGYDGLVLHPIERTAGQSPDATIFMWNPPWTVLPMAPVLAMPFERASLAWIGCNLAILAAMTLLLRPLLAGPPPPAMILIAAAVCFYPALETIALGQVSLLPALGIVLFLRCATQGRDSAAGLSLVWLSIKPHLFLIFGVWVAYWVIRERRWRVAISAALGMAAVILLTHVLFPGALGDWWRSFSRPVRGPGSESTANWITSSLASWVRLILLSWTGRAPLWPTAAVPALGLAATLAYLAVRRPAVTWPDQIHPILCLSVALAPYGWPFDHSVLIVGQIFLAAQAMNPTLPANRRALLALCLAALFLVPILLEGPNSGHHLLAWYPLASLVLWSASRPGKGFATSRPSSAEDRLPGAAVAKAG